MPAGGVGDLKKQPIQTKQTISGPSFGEIFREELSNVKFSAHAQARLASRDISLSDNEVERLQSAVSRARDKGVNESLILLNDKAFIVSVPNKTVITVMDQAQMSDNIVTDIDSAVFA
jgi:flagellar operon protein